MSEETEDGLFGVFMIIMCGIGVTIFIDCMDKLSEPDDKIYPSPGYYCEYCYKGGGYTTKTARGEPSLNVTVKTYGTEPCTKSASGKHHFIYFNDNPNMKYYIEQ